MSGREPRGNLECCVGYRVCFGTRGGGLCKPRDVKIRSLSLCIIREEKRNKV